MSENRALYEQVILDHNKNPRNFRKMEDADQTIEGYNPLCGDHFTIYVKFDGDKIGDISFHGSGCAISKSSASVMTQTLKGMDKQAALRIFEKFHRMITSDVEQPVDEEGVGKLKIFSGVREFPVRIKCATLAWHALASAIEGETGKTVSTE